MKELGEDKQLKILVITNNYPTIYDPVNGTFVRQFIHAMVDNGVKAVVIRPIRIQEIRKRKLPAERTVDVTPNGKHITVYYPRFLSFSWKNMGFFHTGLLTQYNFFYAARTIVKKMDFKPDVVYGHFFTPAGFSAVKLGKMLDALSIIRVGEDFTLSQKVIWSLRHLSRKKAVSHFRDVGGIIANSSHLKEFVEDYLGIPERKILVCPNGVDLGKFYPMDKNLVRRKLSISEDKFIIIFVGAPSKRKGFPILLEALARLEGVYAIFIGKGMNEISIPPNIEKKVLFNGEVKHDEVPLWLNASDVFVLPTLSEGSSNATVEAMACGLPIITDKGSHMDNVVGDKTAIRVNSESVEEVTLAIKKIRDNPQFRNELSLMSLEKAKEFDVTRKARRVIQWLQNRRKN